MASKILVLNAGSSSLKFKLFEEVSSALHSVCGGVVERIGDLGESSLTASREESEEKTTKKEAIEDHGAALEAVLGYLSSVRDGSSGLAAVGHRVVHGKSISEALLVTDDVVNAIRDAFDLAPLHNPANLQGIIAAQQAFPGTPSVAVFDTAFHQSITPAAATYALPLELCRRHGLRRYGAHGTSVQYLTSQAAKMLDKPSEEVNLIVAHIGAGASITAVRKGKSLDTSMGLTPLEGLMMATRCGDIDPSVVLYLQKHCGMSVDDVDGLLNRESGFLGLSGSADLRAVQEAADRGSKEAELALQVCVHRLRKYIGACLAHLEGAVDAIVFSAGIGEHSSWIREHALANFEALGVKVDTERNRDAKNGGAHEIQAGSSEVKVFVIPTDEEKEIAQQTLAVVRHAH